MKHSWKPISSGPGFSSPFQSGFFIAEAEVPFPDHGGAVACLLKQAWQGAIPGADEGRAVRRGDAGAFSGKAVEVRRLERGVAVAGNISVADIVGMMTMMLGLPASARASDRVRRFQRSFSKYSKRMGTVAPGSPAGFRFAMLPGLASMMLRAMAPLG